MDGRSDFHLLPGFMLRTTAIAPPMNLPFRVAVGLSSLLLLQFELIIILLFNQSHVVIEISAAKVYLIEDEEKHEEDDAQEDCKSSLEVS